MKFRATTLPFLAGSIGVLSWSGYSTPLLLLPIIAWIWSTSQSRLTTFVALFFYYAGASRGMINGAGMFYSANQVPAWWIGIVMWTCSSTILASVWAFGWGVKSHAARLCTILLILSVPPIGLIGWANPLTAAGIFYPGLGWFGFCAMLLLMCCIVSLPYISVLTPFFVVSVIAHTCATSLTVPNVWQGINTQLGSVQTIEDEFKRLTWLQKIINEATAKAAIGARIVLPEMVGGDWSINGPWWDVINVRLKEKNQIVFLGAHWPAQHGRGYVNGIVTIGAGNGATIKERVPVPISMWRPWTDDGSAIASWFGTSTTVIDGNKIGHLICYEQILIWPVLATFAQSPNIVIVISNMWWAKETNILAVQREAVEAWSKLFSIQLVSATNL